MGTRVVWNTEHSNVNLGRIMDWFDDIQTNPWTQPFRLKRTGQTGETPFELTCKYGSLIARPYDLSTFDSINTPLLVACMLDLPDTSVSLRDIAIPRRSIRI